MAEFQDSNKCYSKLRHFVTKFQVTDKLLQPLKQVFVAKFQDTGKLLQQVEQGFCDQVPGQTSC